MSVSVSLLIAGLLGILYSCITYQNIIFLSLSIAFLIHPLFAFVFLKITKAIKVAENGTIFKIRNKTEVIFGDYLNSFNSKNLFVLILINLIDTLGIALWTFWISTKLGLDLTFFQILLLQFFLKITILFKFTPGNLGVNQFASSGIILLVGGTAADGFTLSLYQSAITIITSFLIGTVFSLVNMKYFFKFNAE